MFSKLLVSLAMGLMGASGAATAPLPNLANMTAAPLFHVHHLVTTAATGLTPTQIRAAYHLTGSGSGTIAIVDAYADSRAASDLSTFSSHYGLPACTTSNGCFASHQMSPFEYSDSGWALEESLDVQWAHAIAPGAHILLVEARSDSLSDLLAAVNYARSVSGVVSVSMSWGASEFAGEASYDSDFTSPTASFFAAAGDSGNGVIWPSVSSNVIGVGGTTLNMSGNTVTSETAWSGSGGGVSAYEPEPSYQSALVPSNGGHRGVPDVAYDADPNTGFPVYDSVWYQGYAGWWQVGGTSAGTIQWAAIRALGSKQLTGAVLYSDAKTSLSTYFTDITSGLNGSCGAICQASKGYDYVTGLGSPKGSSF